MCEDQPVKKNWLSCDQLPAHTTRRCAFTVANGTNGALDDADRAYSPKWRSFDTESRKLHRHNITVQREEDCANDESHTREHTRARGRASQTATNVQAQAHRQLGENSSFKMVSV